MDCLGANSCDVSMLKARAADLDRQIHSLASVPCYDQLAVQRLKRQKGSIVGQISLIEGDLTPDIIA